MNLLKSLASMSLVTASGRFLCFVRDFLIAYTFGASLETDVFFSIFKIPNLLRRIFTEGVVSQAFIPVLSEYKINYKHSLTKDFISCIFGLLTILLTIIMFISILFPNIIVIIMSPGFLKDTVKLNLAIKLFKIIFPYIIFASLSSFFSSILYIYGVFLIPLFSPILLNICIILFTIFSIYFKDVYLYPQILFLGWGVIFGGFLQTIYQLPFLSIKKILVLPSINFNNIGLKKVLYKLIPSLLGVSIGQISLIINSIIASLFNSGSISWLYYADRLTELPVGILGSSISTLIFPKLIKYYTLKNTKSYSRLLDWSLRISLLLSLPCTSLLIFLSKPFVISLFQYGNFTNIDTLITQKILLCYALGIIALIIVKVLSTAFYAIKDVIIPMKISFLTLLITQILNLFFIFFLNQSSLALSGSISAWINAILLFFILYKKKIFFPQPGWCIFFKKILLSTVIMSISLLFLSYFISTWYVGNMFIRMLRIFSVCVFGSFIYIISLWFNNITIKQFYYED
ncbi:murein biosynthesis integral membrane protein MurJ [Buchnera aphidicola]|uniref:Probable lipid II flippase MurJ n=1 Tax=Buchnera aphidicola (Cinara curvipes) TaxID=2518975 RepID=A0A451D6Q9_9GAMM|nr:murein biosynthesis integral membrane protein MurJ [Buchnera aphidicola]VFP81508.1 Lipid II flippase MurJ [Buchnera aphidicola (Cinara curvipes)]